jgi:BirA family biotin operon repressor/biotin-[acetyl-CoA-carboxylase] ligase
MYYLNKKLGGILIENTLTGSSIKSSVIGIGLNVNQSEFSESISQSATSVIQILQKDVPLMDIMAKIFMFMEKYYLILRAGKYSILQNDYLAKLYNFNISALYKQDGAFFEGIIKGVEDSGRLTVDTNEGLKSFNFKEIEFTHTK